MAGNSAGAKKGWAHRSRFPVARGMIAATRARLGLRATSGSARVKAIRALKSRLTMAGGNSLKLFGDRIARTYKTGRAR